MVKTYQKPVDSQTQISSYSLNTKNLSASSITISNAVSVTENSGDLPTAINIGTPPGLVGFFTVMIKETATSNGIVTVNTNGIYPLSLNSVIGRTYVISFIVSSTGNGYELKQMFNNVQGVSITDTTLVIKRGPTGNTPGVTYPWESAMMWTFNISNNGVITVIRSGDGVTTSPTNFAINNGKKYSYNIYTDYRSFV